MFRVISVFYGFEISSVIVDFLQSKSELLWLFCRIDKLSFKVEQYPAEY